MVDKISSNAVKRITRVFGLRYGYIYLVCLLYGIVCQLAVRLRILEDLYAVMSFGMVFVFPVVAGVFTVVLADAEQRRSWTYRIFAPLLPTISGLLISVAVGWEGAICFIFAAVLFLPLASLGGIVAGLVLSRRSNTHVQAPAVAALLLLPLASAYFEHQLPLPTTIGTAITSIDIDAPSEDVWEEIVEVPQITEPLDGIFYRLGFPKPIEAKVSYRGLGAVRHASFEGNLIFIETVTSWQPLKELGFRIDVDPSSTPTTTLDPHVSVGGRYFDVLEGTYRLESLADGGVRLHLTSIFRISTRFNFYATGLGRLLMSDVQRTILKVVKQRAEKRRDLSTTT